MPYTQHPHDVGVPSYRDESYKERGWSLGSRWTTWAHGVKKLLDDGSVDRNKTHGDILGSSFVKPDSRDFGGWFHAVPAVKTQYGFFPIRDRSFAPDTSFQAIDAAVPSGGQIPNGTPVIILCATKEDGEQELIVMSGGSGAEQAALSLIAANRNDPYEMGTSVYDLNKQGEVDIKNQAKLQSAWKVMTPNINPVSGTTGAGQNFFNLAAQGKNFPKKDGQKTLIKATPKNNKGNVINIGMSDTGGKLKFSKGGKDFDPFSIFGIKKKNGLKFSSPNDEGGGIVEIGIAKAGNNGGGGINIGAPQPSNAGFGNGPGIGFLFNEKYAKPEVTT